MADAKGVYKQDMVVSTRYRNDLPPPPMPPKLLNIDTGGLEQYLTPGFAAAMARREEPNIEADAEGGMPIDMIGIPGYFLGDESAIMAPDHQPLLDPADLALMATPEQLRNATGKSSNVSFLKRTQYISSAAGPRMDLMFRNTAMRPKPFKAQQAERDVVSKDDPIYIKRFIQKGFDIAYPESKEAAAQADPSVKALPAPYAEVEAWRHPVHPDNPKLKPVEFYPLLPDLDSFPEHGGYTSMKFDKTPLPATEAGRRDDRIDVGLLQAAHDQAAYPAWEARSKAYESNPELYESPGEVPLNLALHVPNESSAVQRIKTVFNDSHPSKDSNPTVDGSPEQFEYHRERIYTIVNQTSVQENVYRSIAISLFDPSAPSLSHSRLKNQGQKGAYYYPIHQIMKLRAKPPNPAQTGEGDGVSDAVNLMVHEPSEDKIKDRTGIRAQVDSVYKKEWDDKYPKEPTPEPHPDDTDGDVRMTGSEEQALREAAKGVVSARNGDDDDDMDAEGEADESD